MAAHVRRCALFAHTGNFKGVRLKKTDVDQESGMFFLVMRCRMDVKRCRHWQTVNDLL